MLIKLRNTLLVMASAGLLSACFGQQNLPAAVSDIHDQFGVFLELLIKNNIITDTWNWNFGDGRR
ncbi:hypothetical protein [Aliidiomarina quisquiliarum]|uniref:hypothetical protein n=1 Tax=Aliidiomarina quisquiliarum TaxID=2938947 RepID=UPI00208DF578|nr:hypothetical protein [Aliidiomarina quisquiliarum]MCO4321001.1 hypothetical protein [Aliidiomarina quisquiliarum]